jgi:AcrR family transcriptional regulator
MSKVASELGFTTMSLYRYVDAKDDLYVVMLEHAFGEPPALDPSLDWREQMTIWANAFRDGLRRHPWVLQIPVYEPPLSPRQLGWLESALHAFDGTPLTPQDRLSAMLLVNIYVRGATQLTANLQTDPEQAQQAGRPYAERLAMLATPERFPGIAATLEQPAGGNYAGNLGNDFGIDFDADEFGFGLTTVLDGIQSRIDRLAT